MTSCFPNGATVLTHQREKEKKKGTSICMHNILLQCSSCKFAMNYLITFIFRAILWKTSYNNHTQKRKKVNLLACMYKLQLFLQYGQHSIFFMDTFTMLQVYEDMALKDNARYKLQCNLWKNQVQNKVSQRNERHAAVVLTVWAKMWMKKTVEFQIVSVCVLMNLFGAFVV